jgi:activator of HSP90 ATPase
MTTPLFTRRDFNVGLATLFPLLGIARFSFASAAVSATLVPDDGISRTAESIHQEITFKTSPKRFYEALLDEKQFTKLSGVPAEISREAGGAFSLFGGAIKGRNLELIANQRIVQAWRSEGWDKGIYSIVRFELAPQGAATKLVFDHTGFPNGQAQNLAGGWKEHYWDLLEKFFA